MGLLQAAVRRPTLCVRQTPLKRRARSNGKGGFLLALAASATCLSRASGAKGWPGAVSLRDSILDATGSLSPRLARLDGSSFFYARFDRSTDCLANPRRGADRVAFVVARAAMSADEGRMAAALIGGNGYVWWQVLPSSNAEAPAASSFSGKQGRRTCM